jgi:hypothetical protein
MSIEYKAYNIDDFIKTTPTGEFDLEKSLQIVQEVAAASSTHTDYNLLIDIRQTAPLKNFSDILTIAAEFAKHKGVLRNKIAFILPNDQIRIDRAQFFMHSLDEMSLNIQYFTDYEKAIEWFSTVKKVF